MNPRQERIRRLKELKQRRLKRKRIRQLNYILNLNNDRLGKVIYATKNKDNYIEPFYD